MGRAGRSVSALAAGEAINKATRFVATVLLARTLSLDEFGLVNVGIAVSGVLLSLSALGMPELGAREVAVHPDRSPQVAGLVLTTRIAALAAWAGGAILVVWLLAPAATSVVALAALMAVGLAGSADWLLRGREQMAAVAVATALGGLVVLAGCASLTLVNPSVSLALGVFALGEAVAALATWQRARVGRPELPARDEIRQAVRVAWPLGASALIIYASYANLDTILLAAVRSEAEAGLYSAPYRLFLAANALPIFAAYALLPMLARAHRDGRMLEGRRLLLRAHVLLAGYGTLVLGLAEAGGGTLLSGLFGEDFAGARPTLVLLCIALPWYSIGFPAGYSLIGQERNPDFLKGAAVTGALNVVLMGLLIPTYGAVGAAIATAGALVGGSVVWLVLARVLPPTAILCAALTVASVGGVVSAEEPSLSVGVGLATGALGLSMAVAPVASERLSRRKR